MLSQNNNKPVISSTGDSVEIQKLILLAKNGDKDAYSQVYTLLFTPLYRYILSHSHDVELTKDLCQQVFLKFYEALATYKPEKSPLAYLFTIAHNLLINHFEKEKLRPSIPYDDTLLETFKDDSVDIVSDADTALLSKSIDNYLSYLSEDEQNVLRLYFYAELSYKEIREITGKEEGALRKIKERALHKLRNLTLHLYVEN